MSDMVRVDLSRMMQGPKCAVACRSLDDVDLFLENFKEQFPECVKGWSIQRARIYWNNYESHTGFTTFGPFDVFEGHLSYCSTEWFLEHGYEVIELSDMIDSPEIEESDCMIDMLFGGAS